MGKARKEADAGSRQKRADRQGGSEAADSVGRTEDASDREREKRQTKRRERREQSSSRTVSSRVSAEGSSNVYDTSRSVGPLRRFFNGDRARGLLESHFTERASEGMFVDGATRQSALVSGLRRELPREPRLRRLRGSMEVNTVKMDGANHFVSSLLLRVDVVAHCLLTSLTGTDLNGWSSFLRTSEVCLTLARLTHVYLPDQRLLKAMNVPDDLVLSPVHQII